MNLLEAFVLPSSFWSLPHDPETPAETHCETLIIFQDAEIFFGAVHNHETFVSPLTSLLLVGEDDE